MRAVQEVDHPNQYQWLRPPIQGRNYLINDVLWQYLIEKQIPSRVYARVWLPVEKVDAFTEF